MNDNSRSICISKASSPNYIHIPNLSTVSAKIENLFPAMQILKLAESHKEKRDATFKSKKGGEKVAAEDIVKLKGYCAEETSRVK